MSRLLGSASALLALALVSTSGAQAQQPAGAATKGATGSASIGTTNTTNQATSGTTKSVGGTAAPSPGKASAAANADTPRDPEGIRGISPYWEAINRGDAKFAAKDYDGAAAEYRAAITSTPKKPLGHLRMAELLLKQGKIVDAEEFVENAVRYAGDNLRIQIQSTFLLAGFLELQGRTDEALAAWAKYKALDSATPAATQAAEPNASKAQGPLPPQVYVVSADSRTLALDARKKLEADYAPVLERIKKNVDAADQQTGSAAGTPANTDAAATE